MRKIPFILILLLAAILAGCRDSQESNPPTPSPLPTVMLDISSASAASSSNSGCTVIARRPTPGPTPASPYLPVTAQDWTRGPADAPFTLIEYSDFQ
jgi:hypothetical protein